MTGQWIVLARTPLPYLAVSVLAWICCCFAGAAIGYYFAGSTRGALSTGRIILLVIMLLLLSAIVGELIFESLHLLLR